MINLVIDLCKVHDSQYVTHIHVGNKIAAGKRLGNQEKAFD